MHGITAHQSPGGAHKRTGGLRTGDLAAASKREAAPSEWPCTASIAGLSRSNSSPVRPRGVPVLLHNTSVCSACVLSNCRVGVKDISTPGGERAIKVKGRQECPGPTVSMPDPYLDCDCSLAGALRTL